MIATEVYARWATDQGPLPTRAWYAGDVDLPTALADLATQAEATGYVVLRLTRVYTRTAPMAGGEPLTALATEPRRHPEGLFHMKRRDPFLGEAP